MAARNGIFVFLMLFLPVRGLTAGDSDGNLRKRLHLDTLHQRAPDAQIHERRGAARKLSEFLGHPLILHVWATWCTSCSRELPLLAALAQRGSEGGIRFLAVAVDPPADRPKVDQVLQKAKCELADWIFTDSLSSKPYWAWGVPVTYFIDADGTIQARAPGIRDWSSVSGKDLVDLFRKP
jgi:thiol-disulfide isomerase/thioredoxin